MAYMNPMQGFEPSKTTNNLLWYVNTSARLELNGITLPGLFQDNSQIATVLLVVAVFLEIVGLQFIISETDLGFWKGLMGVSFLLLLDVLFAFLLHLRVKALSRCESERSILDLTCRLICEERQPQRIRYSDGSDTPEFLGCIAKQRAIETARIEDQRRRALIVGYLFGLMIWAVAAFKIVIFWALESVTAQGIDTKAIFIIVTYLIVAIIHTYFTGYALFSFFARLSWWQDEKSFVRDPSRNSAQTRKIQYITPSSIPAGPIRVGGHTLERLLLVNLIVRDDEGNGRLEPGSLILQPFHGHSISQAALLSSKSLGDR